MALARRGSRAISLTLAANDETRRARLWASNRRLLARRRSAFGVLDRPTLSVASWLREVPQVER